MISFQNVSFTYAESGNGGVLDLNLIVRSGECVLLCGPSGCGKTTVTRLANGLIPHFFHGNLSGQVNVNGMDTRETEIAALSDAVGTVFQNGFQCKKQVRVGLICIQGFACFIKVRMRTQLI